MATRALNPSSTTKAGTQPRTLLRIQLPQQIRIQLPSRSRSAPSQRTTMRGQINELPTPISRATHPIHSPDVLQLVDHVDNDARRDTQTVGQIELRLRPVTQQFEQSAVPWPQTQWRQQVRQPTVDQLTKLHELERDTADDRVLTVHHVSRPRPHGS